MCIIGSLHSIIKKIAEKANLYPLFGKCRQYYFRDIFFSSPSLGGIMNFSLYFAGDYKQNLNRKNKKIRKKKYGVIANRPELSYLK